MRRGPSFPGASIGIKDGQAKIFQATRAAAWAGESGIKTITREVLDGRMVALKNAPPVI